MRVSQTATSQFAIHQFKDYIGSETVIDVECECQTDTAPSSSPVYLQIYNTSDGLWETIDYDDSSSANTDFILLDSILDATNYKDGSLVMTCRIYQSEVSEGEIVYHNSEIVFYKGETIFV